MQLGALHYPRYPMASDAEHFHFLEILAGTYDSSIKNMRISDNLWNNTQFICAFPVERVPKHPLSGISTRSGDLCAGGPGQRCSKRAKNVQQTAQNSNILVQY